MAGLPPEIHALAEMSPVEDLLLALLREGLPGVSVQSLIAADQKFPLVLPRRIDQFGEWRGDQRFVDTATVAVHAFVEDPNGDEDAATLSEAVRVVLRNAWLDNKVVPGRGHITRLDVMSAPRRVTDWATASGPVQYADLPTGVWRYETVYDIAFRKPQTRTTNP